MSTLETLQLALAELNTQRNQIIGAGWVLQHCWLVQVKPAGTARTNAKYWQVRSRQPMFDGKTLKHLKPDEVENYKAAIERGRQLKQIDQQIKKLQQQLAKFFAAESFDLASTAPQPFQPVRITTEAQRSTKRPPLKPVEFTDLAEQERLVKEVLANSHDLRRSLRRSMSISKALGARMLDLLNDRPRES